MKEFSHYFRDIAGLSKIDIYRFLELFGVTKSTYQHAVKKIVCAGQRGAKDERKDIGEAIVSLTRALEMLDEDERAATIRKAVEDGDIVLEFGEPPIVEQVFDPLKHSALEPAAEIDEARTDRVASSHGDGEHYDDMSNPANWLPGDLLEPSRFISIHCGSPAKFVRPFSNLYMSDKLAVEFPDGGHGLLPARYFKWLSRPASGKPESAVCASTATCDLRPML